ncbi:hypothetical protein ACHAPQ_010366 [Fusarium lateritium]
MSRRARMKEAAEIFSRILTRNNIQHAFIGGFALQMLDHDRETADIDVEVAVNHSDELRGHIVQILRNADSRFVVENHRLYFVPHALGEPRIPIETLARGSLNLPRNLSIMRPGDGSVPILEPGVLILTKIKRASQFIGSTRPKSMMKFNSDLRDILHLLRWLQAHNQKLDFDKYDASAPERLYDGVRKLRTHLIAMGLNGDVQMLEKALRKTDKAIIMNE